MSKYSTEQLNIVVGALKALANPNRLKIFLELVECCAPGQVWSAESPEALGRCVGELAEMVDIAPSTLSHHLKELNRAGLLEMNRRGQRVECCVAPAAVGLLSSFFNNCCGSVGCTVGKEGES